MAAGSPPGALCMEAAPAALARLQGQQGLPRTTQALEVAPGAQLHAQPPHPGFTLTNLPQAPPRTPGAIAVHAWK